MADAIAYLGIARKGGFVETGEEKAGALVKTGKARLLIVAADASPHARRRAEGYVYAPGVPLLVVPYTKAELSAASGRPGCSMAAFTDLGLAARFAGALAEEYGEQFREIAEGLAARQARVKTKVGKSGKRRKTV